MKCNRLIICFGLLLSAFFSFFLSSDTYALDDIVYTVDSSTPDGYVSICGSDLGLNVDCSDYSYVIFDFSLSCMSDYRRGNVNFEIDGTSNYINICYSPFFIMSYESFSPWVRATVYPDGVYSGWSGIITLTNSLPSSSSSPSGNLDIIENGEYDVTNYAIATVNVPQSVTSEGQYHDDLQDIKQAIFVCGAVLLVIYFFYCIYRMIIKGVKI